MEQNPELGKHFTGKFTEGKMDGNGEFWYENGDFYRGKFEQNKRSGQGICVFMDGTAYIGEWKNDFFYGSGAYLSKDGHVIEGHYCATTPEKPFKMWSDTDLKILYKNGELYDGKGRDGKKDGKGKYFYLDGSVYEG